MLHFCAAHRFTFTPPFIEESLANHEKAGVINLDVIFRAHDRSDPFGLTKNGGHAILEQLWVRVFHTKTEHQTVMMLEVDAQILRGTGPVIGQKT